MKRVERILDIAPWVFLILCYIFEDAYGLAFWGVLVLAQCILRGADELRTANRGAE